MTNNNLPAIRQTESLQKIENKLAITNKLLAEINDDWLVDFFVRKESYFKQLICEQYSLPDRLLDKYFKDSYYNYWGLLSINTTLNWTIELIDREKDYLEWKNQYEKYSFSNNISLPWSIEFIEKYKEEWDWSVLSRYILFSSNNSLYHSLIDKFSDKLIWGGLSKNIFMHWTFELIEKHKEKWNWVNLSGNIALPWSIEFIDKYIDRWDWENLSGNKSLPWTIELLDKFYNKWMWVNPRFHRYGEGYTKMDNNLSSNLFLPWSIELIERYMNKWDWRLLSGNTALPWSFELIDKFYDNWVWILDDNINLFIDYNIICDYDNDDTAIAFKNLNIETIAFEDLVTNPTLPWSIEFIEKYKDKWDWRFLAINSGIKWNTELLNKFEQNLNWMWFSSNKSFKWSIEQIEKYKNSFDENSETFNLFSNISNNTALPWSIDLIEKYLNLWNWIELTQNKSIPWSKELILRFEENWHFWYYRDLTKGLNNYLLSQCTDQIIEKVMIKIQKKP